MKCNIGNTDRTLRILFGLAIGAAGLVTKSWWGLIGILPLGTALARFCPLYVLLGVSTMENKVESHSSNA
jgi:type IV secretory pathway TrbD component